MIELGREGVWVPDYRAVHTATGTDVFVEVLGFWKRSSLERLIRLLPLHGPPRFVLAISDRLKVDEETLGELKAPDPSLQGNPQRLGAGCPARGLRSPGETAGATAVLMRRRRGPQGKSAATAIRPTSVPSSTTGT